VYFRAAKFGSRFGSIKIKHFGISVVKDRKLLIPVRCTTRKFYLHPPPAGRNDWHVRFVAPAVNGVSRVVFRSTGTKEIAAAKRIAAQVIESFWNDAGRGAELLKLRNDNATIGDVIARYQERATQRPGTIRGNVRSLRLIIRSVHSGDPNEKSTTLLTPNLIREFEKRQLRRAEQRATPVSRSAAIEHVRNSTASFARQARSIVALRKMKFYEDMKLPDLTGFRGEGVEAPRRSLPRPLDMKALASMESAAASLAEDDPGAYVAHLLFSRLGLRNIEILNARAHWISGGSIGIIDRPEEDFFPKGCEGWVPVAPDVLAEVLRFQPLCSDGFLIPGRHKSERHDAVYRRHSKWVGGWIKDRTKTSYELRRYAGSRLLDMGATIFEVRDFLRHRDVQTTQMWYAYRLQNRQLRTIGMLDLLPNREVNVAGPKTKR
jgi:integrase